MAGVGATMQAHALPDPSFSQWLPVLGLLVRYVPQARAITLFFVGVLWACVHAHVLYGAAGLPQLQRSQVAMTGCVIGAPRVFGRAYRFEFEVFSVAGRHRPIESVMALADYRHTEPVKPGECYRVKARISAPTPSLNPGAFDYVARLFTRSIVYKGYLIDAAPIRSDSMHAALTRVRFFLRDRVLDALGASSQSALVVALALGLREQLSEPIRDVLRTTGTAHLLAVSGLHIGLAASAAFWLFRLTFARMTHQVASSRLAVFPAISFATVYAVLAGMSIPTQRAVVASAIVLTAVWFRLGVDAWRTLLVVAGALVAFSPPTIVSPSFWMSFLAVAILIATAKQMTATQPWRAFLGFQFAMTLGLIPLTVLIFDAAPTVGFIANAIAIPLTSFVAVPTALLGTLLMAMPDPIGKLLATPLLHLSAWSLCGLLNALDIIATHGPLWSPLARPSLGVAMCAGIGLIVLWGFRSWPLRLMGVFWLFPLLALRPNTPSEGDARVTVLSVGQGTGVVIETHQRTVVVDSGPQFGRVGAVDFTLAPYLRRQRHHQVDLALVSHPDADHASGIPRLHAAVGIEVLAGRPGKYGVPAFDCDPEQHWRWDGVSFEWFTAPHAHGPRLSRNDASCLLRLCVGHRCVLLPGDIERRAELALVLVGRELNADVLVSPHHGSGTSSTAEFLNVVSPRWVVHSLSLNNRFGFPHESVTRRYASLNVRQLTTAHDGAVEIYLSSQGELTVEAYANRALRFWHRFSTGKWRKVEP